MSIQKVPAARPHYVAWRRRVLIALFTLSALASVFFALHIPSSLQMMRSAYALGVPSLSNLRPWMTLHYVATTWRTSQATLLARLNLPADTPPNTDLKTLAETAGMAKLDYTQRVQVVVAELAPQSVANAEVAEPSWWASFGDSFLTALLAYGYPVLALTLLLGALGVPLPAGLVATVAGTLVAEGQLNGAVAGSIAVTACVVGDMLGYGLGRWAGMPFLASWGRWLGHTPARYDRVVSLMQRYAIPTVLITRTLLSSLSAVVNLLAGISRYGLGRFLALAIVGRTLWASAFMGLGYALGGEVNAAKSFLQNLAGLVAMLSVLVLTGLALRRKVQTVQ